MWAGGPPPRPVSRGPKIEESTTVLLRRQVPVRFEEPQRSWLGGCPMMPESVAWPVSPSNEFPDQGDRYLNFVAQIACEDLPDNLWGGLGPRKGWLLVFVDAQDPGIDPYPTTLQVLHIDALGPERQPPEGTPPISNEDYTGYDMRQYASREAIPPIWRRWPVDILSFPIEEFPNPERDEAREDSSPEGRPVSAAHPYGGAAVDRECFPPYMAESVLAEDDWPFSWRGAKYVVDSAIRWARDSRPPEFFDSDREKIRNADWVAAQRESSAAKRDRYSEALATEEKLLAEAQGDDARTKSRERLKRWRERLAEFEDIPQLLEDYGDPDALMA